MNSHNTHHSLQHTYHNVLKVHPHCATEQNFIPFCDWIISHCIDILLFVYSFTNRHLGRFYFEAVRNVTLNISAQVLLVLLFIMLKNSFFLDIKSLKISLYSSLDSLFEIKGGHPDCQYKAVLLVFFNGQNTGGKKPLSF